MTTTPADIRVRFCPSPTGLPHVGLIRTALFNWAYARHTGGTFVFRVEDTDTARDSEESYQQLLEAMRWLGMDWDEGVEVGGPYGPYRQSERSGYHHEVADALVKAGYAYEAFSTAEEVEARHRAAGRDPKLGYDGFDRDLSEEQKAAYRAEGREPVLRFRMPDEDIVFTDVVRGEIRFAAGSVPDYVIVRASGEPLYTLVNPADDAAMRITHVLRGEDLLSSTPRQIALYQALIELGYAQTMPVFGHMPYVMGEGNRKLSKRDPQSNLFLYRDRGFVREGLLNYLALLGWAIGPDRDVFSIQELTDAFDIADVNPNPARFDVKKAEAINAAHLRLLPIEEFRDRMVPYLHQAGLVASDTFDQLPDWQAERLSAAAPLVQPRMTLLGEAPGMLGFLFVNSPDLAWEPEALAALRPQAPAILEAAGRVTASVKPFEAGKVQEQLKEILVEQMGIKPRFAFAPLRTAITGRRVSPPLFESMEILGREACLERMERLRATL